MTLINKIKKILYWDLIGALLCVLLVFMFKLNFETILIENKGILLSYYLAIIGFIFLFFLLFFNFKDEMIMFLKGADVFEKYKWHIYYNFKINFLGIIILVVMMFIDKIYINYLQLFILIYSLLAFLLLIKLISIIITHQSELRMIIKNNKLED